MSGFSRCHRFVLYSWHITVPSVRRRQFSTNPEGNAFASGVHCALAIDDQPARTMSITAELEMFFRQLVLHMCADVSELVHWSSRFNDLRI